MSGIDIELARLMATLMLVVSFMLLYQDRLAGLINAYALQSGLLALAVAAQAHAQEAPHLYVTALLALVVKGLAIPLALHRIVLRLGVHREIEKVIGVGTTMLFGLAVTMLAVLVVLPVTETAAALTREDLGFALAIVLLGLLTMISRRNAVSQVIGFMSLENGLILAATGARGMPLVVEVSVAFSILIAFIVVGIFLFRIRERFDSVDVHALDRFRGELP
ncbi:Hydrogenase-4 component E [bacterium HR40]|nr:Hydrogenase-4 component E [bacterium HR40]